MPTDGERLATVEAVLHELRDDMGDLKVETVRTRERLHDLEGVAGALVDESRQRQRAAQRRNASMNRRLQLLTAVVATAALAEPFLYHLATGR